MANNLNINKVVYGQTILLDLTEDTVTSENLAMGIIAHDKSGARIVGTMSGGTNPILFSTQVNENNNYDYRIMTSIFNLSDSYFIAEAGEV